MRVRERVCVCERESEIESVTLNDSTFVNHYFRRRKKVGQLMKNKCG